MFVSPRGFRLVFDRLATVLPRCAICLSAAVVVLPARAAEVHLAQGMIAGEVTSTSVILQTRLTAVPAAPFGQDIVGAAGVVRFEVAANAEFKDSRATPWLTAKAENDFIVKTVVHGLRPGTHYFYRAIFGTAIDRAGAGPVARFRTLPGEADSVAVKFVVSSCMNYAAFHLGHGGRGGGYQGADKAEGFPTLEPILALAPDFWVGNGDNVYYDHIKSAPARTPAGMRAKWHEQFAMPRLVRLLSSTSAYFLKDDHDYRFNDADGTGDVAPSHELGIRMFREQVPIVDPATPEAVTYRTVRVGRHAQLWFLEGRDYRSPNRLPDEPEKSVWGREQQDWLHRTLRESDATFKILISPSPLVGPDTKNKHDNHANAGGFQYEARELFRWLGEARIPKERFAIICGDRHWKYHSIHPSGYEEFGTGALNVENAVVGARFAPGARLSSDPKAEIRQLFVDAEARGGFLQVRIDPQGDPADSVTMTITLHGDRGMVLHTATRTAR